jgi:hypothetical protein
MISRLKVVFDIRKQNKRKMFIVLMAFLASFAAVRFYSLNFTHYVHIEGFHIHHFYFGTVALVLGGILALITGPGHVRRENFASALIGIGIGLFADEIGLLLNCTTENHLCTYYFPDAGDIITTIAIIIVFLIALVDTASVESIKNFFHIA